MARRLAAPGPRARPRSDPSTRSAAPQHRTPSRHTSGYSPVKRGSRLSKNARIASACRFVVDISDCAVFSASSASAIETDGRLIEQPLRARERERRHVAPAVSRARARSAPNVVVGERRGSRARCVRPRSRRSRRRAARAPWPGACRRAGAAPRAAEVDDEPALREDLAEAGAVRRDDRGRSRARGCSPRPRRRRSPRRSSASAARAGAARPGRPCACRRARAARARAPPRRPLSARSAPEQNPSPAPVITSTRSSAVRRRLVEELDQAAHISPVIAFFLLGPVERAASRRRRRARRAGESIARLRVRVRGIQPVPAAGQAPQRHRHRRRRAARRRAARAVGRASAMSDRARLDRRRRRTTAGRGTARAAVPGREDLPLPGLRPRDPARRGPQGRGPARRTRGSPPLAHRLLAPRATPHRRSRGRQAPPDRSAIVRTRLEHVDVPAAAPVGTHRRDVEAQRPAPRRRGAPSQRPASIRSRCCLRAVTASAGRPNASPRRVFTSQNTIVRRVADDEVELAFADAPVAVERPS